MTSLEYCFPFDLESISSLHFLDHSFDFTHFYKPKDKARELKLCSNGFSFSSFSPNNYRGGNHGGGDYRPIIHYRDLDAPREPDDFL